MINDRNEVLVSDECRHGYSFTKFPGGGLEFGEGLLEGLKREFEEELGITVEVGKLFYVNDFYQESAFNENHQLLSFYYLVQYSDWKNITIKESQNLEMMDYETPRWIALTELSTDDFTFPIDKIVANKIVEKSKIF